MGLDGPEIEATGRCRRGVYGLDVRNLLQNTAQRPQSRSMEFVTNHINPLVTRLMSVSGVSPNAEKRSRQSTDCYNRYLFPAADGRDFFQ